MKKSRVSSTRKSDITKLKKQHLGLIIIVFPPRRKKWNHPLCTHSPQLRRLPSKFDNGHQRLTSSKSLFLDTKQIFFPSQIVPIHVLELLFWKSGAAKNGAVMLIQFWRLLLGNTSSQFSLCWPLVAISELQISIHGQKKDRKGTSKKKKCFKMKLGYRIFVKISRAYISRNRISVVIFKASCITKTHFQSSVEKCNWSTMHRNEQEVDQIWSKNGQKMHQKWEPKCINAYKYANVYWKWIKNLPKISWHSIRRSYYRGRLIFLKKQVSKWVIVLKMSTNCIKK